MARHAPGPCATCGFYLPLAGSLRQTLGACGNAYAPADGRVVTADYGCGAHSQATLVADDATEVVRTARYDTGGLRRPDGLTARSPSAARRAGPAGA